MSERSRYLTPSGEPPPSRVCPNCRRLVARETPQCPACGHALTARPSPLPGASPLRLGPAGPLDRLFTPMVVWGCVLLYALTLLLDPSEMLRGGLLNLLSPASGPLFLFGMSGRVPVFEAGRWWTVLSAAWLHGSLLHIFFNMMWIRQLAPMLSRVFGFYRLTLLYTISSIAGFGLTSAVALLDLPGPLSGAAFTVGASAPLFGLFGALVVFGQKTGNPALSRQFTRYLVLWIFIGVMASSGSANAIRIDNWAHLGGFAGGFLVALWLDPRQPEQPWHRPAGIVCLVLTVLSILGSVLHGLLGLS